MNFTIHPTPFSITIIILVLALGAYWCYLGYSRNPRKLTAWLEALRFFILCIISFLLLQPEWVQVSNPTQAPNISILCDASESMQTQDVILPDNSVLTRSEKVKQLLDHPAFNDLRNSYQINVSDICLAKTDEDNKASFLGTDLATPLSDQIKEANNLKAIVLLSDGSHNAETIPQEVAQRMKTRKIPLYTIPVGSETFIPDIELIDVKIPSYGILGETIQIPFSIKNSFDTEKSCTVQVVSETSGQYLSKNIVIPPNSTISDAFIWPVKHEGQDKILIKVPALDEEKLTQNNQNEALLEGRKESIKVLVIDSLPRWEYRFIRNALYRDPGVEVNTLLFHPHLSIRGDGPGYLQEFPSSLDQLSQYDVVFIGDVGLGDKGLTLDQASLLKGLVANQASGIIFLPGSLGNQNELKKTELEELIPVITTDDIKGTREAIPLPLSLTKEGQSSLLTLLADTEEENVKVWNSLPGFNWFAPVKRAKAGASVLATHPSISNEFGRLPLLITKPFGNGKVLYMATDSAWKWRRGVEDLYHYRFWGQVARWMSYQRKMAAGEAIKLIPSIERPNTGDVLHMVAMAKDKMGAPMSKGDVYLEITKPDGTTSLQQLQSINGTWGSYAGNVKINMPGTWKFKASSSETPDKPTNLELTTGNSSLEKLGQPINLNLLEELSRIAQGRCIHDEDIEKLCEELKVLPTPPPIQKRMLLWCNPYVLGGILLLLAGFWVGRKLNGTL